MANFRTYKNGIYGKKYKNYYIAPGTERASYHVLDENSITIADGFRNIPDAEWEIDKLTATSEELEVIKSLYEEDRYTLEGFFNTLFDKITNKTATDKELKLYEWVAAIRYRKLKDRPY